MEINVPSSWHRDHTMRKKGIPHFEECVQYLFQIELLKKAEKVYCFKLFKIWPQKKFRWEYHTFAREKTRIIVEKCYFQLREGLRGYVCVTLLAPEENSSFIGESRGTKKNNHTTGGLPQTQAGGYGKFRGFCSFRGKHGTLPGKCRKIMSSRELFWAAIFQ